jgi:hypothetical protein
MTRLELQQRTLRALHDSPTAPTYWAATEIQAYLQEALEVLAEDVAFVKRTFTIPRRPGVVVYQTAGISPTIIAPYRVWLPDYQRRLDSRTLVELDGRYERWLENVGIPECWVSLSWDQFLIWLHPTTQDGTLELNCYCWPDSMDADSDVPELPPTSHEALALYAEGLGRLKQWQGQETVERWDAFFKRYGHVRSQAGINRVQSRFWGRNGNRATDQP